MFANRKIRADVAKGEQMVLSEHDAKLEGWLVGEGVLLMDRRGVAKPSWRSLEASWPPLEHILGHLGPPKISPGFL